VTVTTVRGDIDRSELGVTLSHEHVLINLFRVYQPHRDMYLHDEVLAVRELNDFVALGGGTVVDLTTPDLGRKPRLLHEISIQTGLNIVMGCGRYRTPFYEPAIERLTTAELAQLFIDDIRIGVDGVRPGVIGEIGTDLDYVNPIEERVHRAAARAAVETGLPLFTHSLGSSVGSLQLDIFRDEGLSAERVAIGHADTWPDREYHLKILDQGAYLSFDTIRGQVPYETHRTIDLIKNAVDHGFADQILFSHDVCSTGHYKQYGGHGYTYVPGDFLVELERSGLPPAVGAGALTANPARFFDHA
jgi:predicted metal-dependent phosphotriesterase family hydrolase